MADGQTVILQILFQCLAVSVLVAQHQDDPGLGQRALAPGGSLAGDDLHLTALDGLRVVKIDGIDHRVGPGVRCFLRHGGLPLRQLGQQQLLTTEHLLIGHHAIVFKTFHHLPQLIGEAAALLHDPRILFLDEPTIGLDAVSKIAVRDFIKALNREKNTTVILTTHDMQDIEALTDRILLIGKGHILIDGSLEQLKHRRSSHKTITVDYTGSRLPVPAGVTVLNDLDGHAQLTLDTEKTSASDVIAQIAAQVDVTDISVTGETIDQTVVSLYKEFSI